MFPAPLKPSIEAIPAPTAPSKPRWARVPPFLRLIAQDQGAPLAEIMSATVWQPHSVRGFISTASKKRGIESIKDDAGQRRYRLID